MRICSNVSSDVSLKEKFFNSLYSSPNNTAGEIFAPIIPFIISLLVLSLTTNNFSSKSCLSFIPFVLSSKIAFTSSDAVSENADISSPYKSLNTPFKPIKSLEKSRISSTLPSNKKCPRYLIMWCNAR